MRRRFGWLLVAVWMLAIVALTGCDSRKVVEIDLSERIDDSEMARVVMIHDNDNLRFGFDLRSSPDEDARQYLPFLKYLEGATGLHFDLSFISNNNTVVDRLGTGKVQFAAIGADTYIQAHTRYGIIPLVRGLNAQGRAEYRAVIIVAPDSPTRKIEELRGKRFAFGSVTSTQGHLIPRIMLSEHGISLDDLAGRCLTSRDGWVRRRVRDCKPDLASVKG